MDIVGLQKLIKHIGGETSSEMQLHTLMTFLAIAQAGDSGVPQSELEAKLEMAGGTISRNVAYWSKVRADKKAGYDMIERFEDEMDRRVRILRLNQKGKRFLEVIKMFLT